MRASTGHHGSVAFFPSVETPRAASRGAVERPARADVVPAPRVSPSRVARVVARARGRADGSRTTRADVVTARGVTARMRRRVPARARADAVATVRARAP